MRTNSPTHKAMAKTGAPLGNTNAKKDGETNAAFLSVRCKRSEKNSWVRAANAAKAQGLLNHALEDGRQSVLAAWVTLCLNAEAARRLKHKT